MVLPPVTPGMKQPGEFSGLWVQAGKVRPLVGVTGETRQREILLGCGTFVLFRDDMVHLKRKAREWFRELAVFAAALRAPPDRCLQAAVHPSRGRNQPFQGESSLGLEQLEQPARVSVVLQLGFFAARK